MGFVLFFLGFGALASVVVYVGRQQQKRRTAAMQAMAERLGWGFQERPPLSVIPGLDRFEPFTHGHGRRIRNFLAGQKGELRAAVFDYSYATGGGKSQTTWQQTVLYLRSERLALPLFALRPESVFHRIGGLFGYQDIDLEAHPDFSQRFLLRGADEAAIRAAFTPEVVEFYEANPGECTAAEGSELLFWRTGELVDTEKVTMLLEAGLDLLRRFEGQTPGAVADSER